MAEPNSNNPSSRRKTSFPLFLHGSGQWCKKVHRRHIYFGTDKDAALRLWLSEKDDWLAGRNPRIARTRQTGQLQLAKALNLFLTVQNELRLARQQTSRNWHEKRDALTIVLDVLGRERAVEELTPDDFHQVDIRIRRRYGRAGQRKTIAHVKHAFTWLFDNGYLLRPVRLGSNLQQPSVASALRERDSKGKRYFEPEIIRDLLQHANQPLKSFILLAINCGLGNTDLALLRDGNLDLTDGWLDYPRNKTLEPRRAKLWHCTVESVKSYAEHRKPVADGLPGDLTFRTARGAAWGREDTSSSMVSQAFRKLLVARGHYRPNLSFYVLRSTYRTVADGARDTAAVDLSMGHSAKDVGGRVYRSHLQDEQKRLEHVADYVYGWLFGQEVTP